MDFYITSIETGESLHVPLLPDKLKISGGDANTITMNIISMGEVKLPRGVKAASYTWEGVFPGENARALRGVADWQSPLALKQKLEYYRDNGTKLRFMATELAINDDVYVEKISGTFAGGHGDYNYNITLQKWRAVSVKTTSEQGVEVDTVSRLVSAHYAAVRPASVISKYITHTVVEGDTLYSIAKTYLGSGDLQENIYQLNKEMMDAANRGRPVEKYKIYVGQVLLVKFRPEAASAAPSGGGGDSEGSSGGGSGGGGGSSSKKKTTNAVSAVAAVAAVIGAVIGGAAKVSAGVVKTSSSSSSASAVKIGSAIDKIKKSSSSSSSKSSSSSSWFSKLKK